MVDHPIHELEEVRKEVRPPNKHTRLAIFFCTVMVAIAAVIMLVFGLLTPASAPPDPIAQGAPAAFDVVP